MKKDNKNLDAKRRQVEEKKTERKKPVVLRPLRASGVNTVSGLLAGGESSSIFGPVPNQTYRFKMSAHNIVSSTAGGILSGVMSMDPNTTSFPEFSTISALFSEVRLVKASIMGISASPGASADIKNALYIGWDDQNVNAVPTTVNAMIDNSRFFVHHLASVTPHIYSAPKISDREWAYVGTPSPGPYAGCTGQFGYYATTLSATTVYFEYVIVGIYEFRNKV